ncbi:putative RNA-directed DNA polymerase from transposon X-element [Trichonephila clavipes]|nr:putative RNA-directed DNA polymerase from transposon X-element [Trichonephila clavipes]
MDISRDNSFLVIACDDQSLHVRSLTTGSEAHVIQGLSAELTAVCFGHDNCRCVVGCADGKCYVFDVHFASSLIATISGHSEAICSVQVQANDTFLVTAGGNKVAVWSFTLPKKENIHKKQKVKRLDSHREPIMCMSVSKDGTLAVSGLGTRLTFGIGLRHFRTAITSQCEPFAGYLCAAESKHHYSPQISRHMP